VTTVYGVSTATVPPYRRLAGATWGAPGPTVDVGSSQVGGVEMRGDPRANEIVAATSPPTSRTRARRAGLWSSRGTDRRARSATLCGTGAPGRCRARSPPGRTRTSHSFGPPRAPSRTRSSSWPFTATTTCGCSGGTASS
jgi:hypothetical protein